jgi:peptide chain release factor subunit 1
MKREKRLMQKKEEETRLHLSSVAELLKAHFAHRHFDKLIIGGRKPLGDHLARLLYGKLHDNLIGVFEIDIHARENDILLKAIGAERQFELQEENKLLRKITDEIEKDGYAVKGTKSVIEAVHSYNLQTLVVAEDFSQRGSVCPRCGMPHFEEKTCTSCGEALVQVTDVVYDIVEEAARQGATVRHIHGANLIGSLENIAAIIKFKTGELVQMEEAAETEV